jgi:pimeloyl-ACP methyl ester carboxylesterase
MSLKLIGMHGNPGFPDDFQQLWACMPYEGIGIAPEEAALRTAAVKAEGDWALLAYSWGAYKALKILARNPKLRPKRLFLIAPYLRTETPLPWGLRTLVSLPWLGRSLVTSSYPRWRDDFVSRMFEERDMNQILISKYQSRLGNATIWKRVVERKIEQQLEPLGPGLDVGCPVTVILGDKDRITDPTHVQDTLRSLGLSLRLKTVVNGQHGLLWTHPREVSLLLTEDLLIRP